MKRLTLLVFCRYRRVNGWELLNLISYDFCHYLGNMIVTNFNHVRIGRLVGIHANKKSIQLQKLLGQIHNLLYYFNPWIDLCVSELSAKTTQIFLITFKPSMTYLIFSTQDALPCESSFSLYSVCVCVCVQSRKQAIKKSEYFTSTSAGGDHPVPRCPCCQGMGRGGMSGSPSWSLAIKSSTF